MPKLSSRDAMPKLSSRDAMPKLSSRDTLLSRAALGFIAGTAISILVRLPTPATTPAPPPPSTRGTASYQEQRRLPTSAVYTPTVVYTSHGTYAYDIPIEKICEFREIRDDAD